MGEHAEPVGGDPLVEQRLFEVSPLGTAATAVIILAVPLAAFFAIAGLSDIVLISIGNDGVVFDRSLLWIFALSLLGATVLGLQRYRYLADLRDLPRFAAIFRGGEAIALRMIRLRPPPRRMAIATAAGVTIGLALTVFLLYRDVARGEIARAGLTLWIGFAATCVIVLFTRGIAMTIENAAFRRILDRELVVDLLHADRLAAIGRGSARVALIWMGAAAALCLFLADGSSGAVWASTVAVNAGIGVWIFLAPLAVVRARIRSAKLEELAKARDAIAAAHREMGSNPAAAARLPGLIAYEARIIQVPEWPFDQTTVMRFASYLFIPVTPWFGAAAAEQLVIGVLR